MNGIKDFHWSKQHLFRGLFFGLGADGTVSANKNTIKIIGEVTDDYVQGYFVYDSKKSGSLTVSHLRFSEIPIRSTYLINSANFIACHHFNYLKKYDVLKDAEEGAVFLLNTPYPTEEVWQQLPKKIQEEIIQKEIEILCDQCFQSGTRKQAWVHGSIHFTNLLLCHLQCNAEGGSHSIHQGCD